MGSPDKLGLLERLNKGVVIGDGGFVFALEKRGYVKAGPWTPEATIEFPDAVRQLHREFLRAGSDIMQTFTFYASDDKLENRGNNAKELYSGSAINEAACRLAHQVAKEGGALVCGGLSQTPSYLSGKDKLTVQQEFRKQVNVFVDNKVDFLLCEYFEHVEEIEWAIEVCKESDLTVCASMCIGPDGDMHGMPTGECAIRMAKAGAEVVGMNCHFGLVKSLETMAIMKKALDAADLRVHLIAQPLAYHTPDAGKQGFIDLPEFPFALEPRISTRWDIQKWARAMYNLGVRYIGGCCGFEAYHIRAVAEELSEEHGGLPQGSQKHDMWGGGLMQHTKPWVRARAERKYWENLNPVSGRPYAASLSIPDAWGVTQGDDDLIQQKDTTSEEQLSHLFDKKATICKHRQLDNRYSSETVLS